MRRLAALLALLALLWAVLRREPHAEADLSKTVPEWRYRDLRNAALDVVLQQGRRTAARGLVTTSEIAMRRLELLTEPDDGIQTDDRFSHVSPLLVLAPTERHRAVPVVRQGGVRQRDDGTLA